VTEMTASGLEPGSPPHKPSLLASHGHGRAAGGRALGLSYGGVLVRPSPRDSRGRRRRLGMRHMGKGRASLQDFRGCNKTNGAVVNPVVHGDNLRPPLQHAEENADGPEVLVHRPAVATPSNRGHPGRKEHWISTAHLRKCAQRNSVRRPEEALGPNEPATGCLRLGYASYPER
jgi:hypothetical protein